MPPKRAATTSSCSGDRRCPPRSPTPCSTLRERAHHSRRAASHRRRTARRVDKETWWRGTAYNAGMLCQVRDRALTRLPLRRGGAGQRIPLPRPRFWTARRWWWRSQSGETADTLEAVRHAKDQKARAGDLQHQRCTDSTRVRRRVYTHADPRSAWRRRSVSLAQIAAAYLVGLARPGPRYLHSIQVARVPRNSRRCPRR